MLVFTHVNSIFKEYIDTNLLIKNDYNNNSFRNS